MNGAPGPRFCDIVAAVLEVDPAEVTDESTQDTIASWTSLRHLQMVAALEESYGLSLSYQEIRGLRSLGQVRELLRGHGVAV